ncbi:unannotated protein [freshwater metagenome]|uniref:Unannotated protein n=1 Tax=freshwater metagenome TaxID=449393 RepID=A0A6J6M8H9_9ZZZZ
MDDPYEILGITRNTSPHEIRSAWRELAKKCHPDVGGKTSDMVRLNEALRMALTLSVNDETQLPQDVAENFTAQTRQTHEDRSRRVRQDISSFTFNVLPVESFELLEIVANEAGIVIESDCPYLIEFSLESFGSHTTASEWCRCELVPEAGGTMVHLTVGGPSPSRVPDVEFVRDELIRCINEIEPINLVEPRP